MVLSQKLKEVIASTTTDRDLNESIAILANVLIANGKNARSICFESEFGRFKAALKIEKDDKI